MNSAPRCSTIRPRTDYDGNGNVATRTAPKPNQFSCSSTVVTAYSYDALNRLTSKLYSDGTPLAQYFYDQAPTSWPAWSGVSFGYSVGRMTLACTGSPLGGCSSPQTAVAYSYDQMGRALNLWQCSPTKCSNNSVFSNSYSYDLAGDLLTSTRPLYSAPNSALTIGYSYNSAQQVTSVSSNYADSTHPGTVAQNITYTPFGALSTLANGCVGASCVPADETYSYNNRLQPVVIQVGQYGGSSSAFACTVYNYYLGVSNPTSCTTPTQGSGGNNGNVMGYFYQDSANSSFGHSAAFTYDSVNRLATAVATGASTYNMTYGYDRYGNATCVQNGQSQGAPCPQMSFSPSTNQITTIGLTSASYDAAGNMTSDPSEYPAYTYQWDAENHLSSVNNGTRAAFVYNALGWQVEQHYSSGSEDFELVRDQDGGEIDVCSGWLDNGGRCDNESYIKLGSRNLGTYWPTESYFDHVNNLGSTTILTAHDGSFLDDTVWYPFGEVWKYFYGCSDWHFAGMQDVADYGRLWPVYHYPTPNRRYNPSLYRWLTPDPAGRKAVTLTDPQTWNMYAYVRNNPTTLTDPSGLKIICSGDQCNRYIAELHKATGMEFSIDKKGVIHITSRPDDMSTAAKEIADIVGDKHKVSIFADSHLPVAGGFFGGHGNQYLNFNRIDNLSARGGFTPDSVTVHETVEAYTGLLNRNNFALAHEAGIQYENLVRLQNGLGARDAESPGIRTPTKAYFEVHFTVVKENGVVDLQSGEITNVRVSPTVETPDIPQ